MSARALGFSKTLDMTLEEAIPRVTEALKKEGFGVLTEIDVKDTLKKKIGVDFRKYRILGACNPGLAHQALSLETEIGLFMPCNVIVYENDAGKAVVTALNPVVALSRIENPKLAPLAEEGAQKLKKAVEAI